jgi:curved DNA-binding protein CbpA
MGTRDFVDLYEILQVSSSAQPETIHRVYRILAQQLHPDNPTTGDDSQFRWLSEAYQTLSDPERRAAYDVQYRQYKKLYWQIFGQNGVKGIEAERQRRTGVLAALYRARMANPQNGSMTLHELEDLLDCPKEHLEFSMWFLKELQHIQRGDNGRYTITIKGAESAEEWQRPQMEPVLPLLNAALRVA